MSLATAYDIESKVAGEFFDAQQAAISVLKRWATEGRDDESAFDRAVFQRLGWSDRQVDVEFARLQTALSWQPKILAEAQCQKLDAEADKLEAEAQKAIEALNAKIAELQGQAEAKRHEVAKVRQKALNGRQARQAIRDLAPSFVRVEYERAVKAWNDGPIARKMRETGSEVSMREGVVNLQLSQEDLPSIRAHLETAYPECLIEIRHGSTFVRNVDIGKWEAYKKRLSEELPKLREELAKLKKECDERLEDIAVDTLEGYLAN